MARPRRRLDPTDAGIESGRAWQRLPATGKLGAAGGPTALCLHCHCEEAFLGRRLVTT